MGEFQIDFAQCLMQALDHQMLRWPLVDRCHIEAWVVNELELMVVS